MASRSQAALTIAALLVLAGCQHGGSNAIPAVSPQSLVPNRETATFSIPQTAPAGVRTYVHLPLRNSADLDKLIQAQSSQDSPLYHHFLTPQQFRETYGPRLQDLQATASALQSQGFRTTLTSQGVIADAPQATVERTFGIKLAPSAHMLRTQSFRETEAMQTLAANRAPVLPEALKRMSAHVAAFAPLPQMQTNFDRRPLNANEADNRYSATGPYWFTDLKQAYEWPSNTVLRGTGKTIAILGARDFSDSDAAAFFAHEHLSPSPTITRRPVDGGPAPFSPTSGNSFEANLDVQQSAGAAPGAHIIFYGAPNASIVPSFLDMYSAIVEDNTADVASASFSLCELYFTAAYNGGQDFTFLFQDFHDVFRQGNAQGITFVNSSGDRGAKSCTNPLGTTAIFGVDFPNQDPSVTGVGGTNLVTSHIQFSLRSTYVRENAYFDPIASAPGVPSGSIWGSGGGISTYWDKPLFQYFVNTRSSHRTVPDLSLQMGGCPTNAVQPCGPDRSASVEAFAGGFYGVIGTSASAPEFAGLQALQDQRLGGRAGNANYLIYGLARIGSLGNGPIYHNNIPGNNGYPSHYGYNYVVGNGSVRGSEYALRPFGPFAGDPQTTSNP